jgi:putative nucleotidyltransferase with HDIG domain
VSLEPTLTEQELLAETFEREGSGLTLRELRVSVLAGIGFFAAVAALLIAAPPHGVALAAPAACLLVLIVATRVRFDTPFGFTVPSQLGFVPLLFSMPVSLVPLAMLPLLGLFALFARERHERLESLLELNNAYRGTALVLGDVVEADDSYTGMHCKGVVGLALEVADELGLEAARRRNLEFAALLHDVGKIAIPKEIVNKPGKLNAEEWTIIKTHTLEGQKMLNRVGGFMREVGQIVRSHHERWDGGGYPDGLSGEEIPLEARIIACCDSWNAMRTDRPYRKALSHEVALAELLGNSGTQYDPRVVVALLAVVAAGTEPPDVTRPRLPAHADRAGAPTAGALPATGSAGRAAPV